MNIIRQGTVKTRKVHYCHGCTKEIPKDADAIRVVCVDGGSINVAYWCEDCDDLLNNLEPWQLEDGFAFGELKEYIND